MKQATLVKELPLPPWYDPKKVENWARLVKYQDLFQSARAFGETHSIGSAALDRLKIALLPIDVQNTFCYPDFELFVRGLSGTGAMDDSRRLAEFIYRNLRHLTSIHPTMDTHRAWAIFHASFLVNDKGEHPDPHYPTPITLAEIEQGKWRVDPKAAFAITGDGSKYRALQAHLVHYARKLSEGGKYALTVWPFHAMLGGYGHALVPSIEEACFAHSIIRGAQTGFEIKGGNELTENYSIFAPEVLTTAGDRPIDQRNTRFLDILFRNDVVVIAGEAKSHCVAWSIADLLGDIQQRDPALAQKVYLLEDCTSNVVVPGVIDFSQQGDEAFQRFAAAGMHLVRSTDPISSWPGIDASQLGS